MKKTIEINGDVYEITKKGDIYINSKKSIFDLYKRPSETKIKIYNYWKDKLTEITALSWNAMFFCIYWIITHEWRKYNVKITPAHNYIYMSN